MDDRLSLLINALVVASLSSPPEALRVASTDLSGVVPDEVCALKGRGELEFVTSTCSQLRCVCCDKCS